MSIRQSAEKGQILVILTFGIIALLGFVALAIDGGMLYADRRYDQNIADNAALAGAGAAARALYAQGVSMGGFNCSSSAVKEATKAAYSAVETSAAEFNINGDRDLSDGQGVLITCSQKGGESGNSLLITVKLTGATKTQFAELVFGNQLKNTVEAVTRVEPGIQKPGGPTADGAGLVGLSQNCDSDTTMLFDGTIKLTILSGGVHSNSCMNKKGISGYIVTQTGSQYRTEFAGQESAFCIGGTQSACKQTTPVLTDTVVKLKVEPPQCSQLERKTYNRKSTTISPGRYSEWIQGGGNLTFAPGLYCFEAGAKFTTPGTLSVSGDNQAGITIYVTGGDFEIGGGVEMNLRAPSHEAKNSGLAVPGMLLYTPENYTGRISFLGSANSYLRGTVYVPAGNLNIGGNSYTRDWAAQMLAKWVKVNGGTSLELNYGPGDLFWDNGTLSLPLVDVYQ